MLQTDARPSDCVVPMNSFQIVIGRAGVMLGGDVGAEQDAETVVRLPFEREDAAQLVGPHGGLGVGSAADRIGIMIGNITALIVHIQRHAGEQRVGERNIHRALQASAAIIAHVPVT